MEELLSTFMRAVFTDNMLFAYYLGMCSFLAVSKNVKTALGLGIAVTFILVCTLPINYMLENYVLKEGALSWLGAGYAEVNLSFLSLLIFIAVIASFVQLVEMVVERYAPALYTSLGIFLPLIAVNCAILGGSLFMQQKAFANAGVATVYGLGSGLGWLLAIVGMAAIREKLAYSNIPKPLRGLGITFIITGLMGIGFMCFSGLKI
jgi:Na+-transporting NADH:ubiquinone oxidoreductase subunit E